MTATSQSGFLEWRHIKHAEVKRGLFMLKTAQNQYYYFPVSAVSDPEELHQLIASKVDANQG